MYLGDGERTRVDFIKTLVDQYHGLEKVNSPVEVRDTLGRVFANTSKHDQIMLGHEFQILMMQWNYNHPGQESGNPYAGLFHYLDAYAGR